MEILRFKRWTLRVDVEATRNAYALVSKGSAEECFCLSCQNYVLCRDKILPKKARSLFKRMGVDFTKEVKLFDADKLNSGFYAYSGWLHYIGHIESGRDSSVLISNLEEFRAYSFNLEPVGDRFDVGFTDRDIGLYHETFSQHPLVQIEFMAELPWLLSN